MIYENTLASLLSSYVCPALGVILANMTCTAPIKDAKAALANASLGDLNPTPWAFMTGNCLGWIAYSYVTVDYFVLAANAPGVLVSLWLNGCAMKLQYFENSCSVDSSDGSYHKITNVGGDSHDIIEASDFQDKYLNKSDITADTSKVTDLEEKLNTEEPSMMECQELHLRNEATERSQSEVQKNMLVSHEKKFLSIMLLWLTIVSTIFFTRPASNDVEMIIGTAANINLLFFFGSPLSVIYSVIRLRDSSSIHLQTMMMNSGCSTFWCIYGISLGDPYIFLPNGCGVIFGAMQMLLLLKFPRRLHSH